MLAIRSTFSHKSLKNVSFFKIRNYSTNKNSEPNLNEPNSKRSEDLKNKEKDTEKKLEQETFKKEAEYQALIAAYPTTKSIVFFVDLLTSKLNFSFKIQYCNFTHQ